MKKVWLVYPYGPVYGEIGKECRYTQFGRELSSKGYSVIWWTANFSHSSKEYRKVSDSVINVCENFTTVLVPTKSYKRNISIGRVLFERSFARNLKKHFNNSEKPDIIIVAGTGMFNAFEPCISFAKNNNIPLIYDIMDVSLVESYFNQRHRLLSPLIMSIMKFERYRERTFFEYICGISALGKNQLTYAKKRAFNREVPSCIVYNSINVHSIRKDMQFADISNLLGNKADDEVWCVYAGSLAPSYDIDTIIQCAKICEQNNNSNYKFIIAGKGPQEEKVRMATNECSNIKFCGYVDLKTLFDIYGVCDIGLCPYMAYQTVDMPDKFYDYCAAGLAIVNSSHGEVQELIDTHNLGKHYTAENPNSMYEMIKEITSDLDTYKKNAYKVGSIFDISEQLAKLSQLVETVLLD